jgi:hypothetical protein
MKKPVAVIDLETTDLWMSLRIVQVQARIGVSLLQVGATLRKKLFPDWEDIERKHIPSLRGLEILLDQESRSVPRSSAKYYSSENAFKAAIERMYVDSLQDSTINLGNNIKIIKGSDPIKAALLLFVVGPNNKYVIDRTDLRREYRLSTDWLNRGDFFPVAIYSGGFFDDTGILAIDKWSVLYTPLVVSRKLEVHHKIIIEDYGIGYDQFVQLEGCYVGDAMFLSLSSIGAHGSSPKTGLAPYQTIAYFPNKYNEKGTQNGWGMGAWGAGERYAKKQKSEILKAEQIAAPPLASWGSLPPGVAASRIPGKSFLKEKHDHARHH